MDTSPPTLTRYLLGELPEAEQTALEEAYFGDPLVFEEVAKVESSLVDDYVRGRLSIEARQRFEQHYMADPRRRERVRFAEALATTLDRSVGSALTAVDELQPESAWRAWLTLIRGARLAPALAVVLLLIIASGVWFVVDDQRARREAAQAEAARVEAERRARETREQPPPITPTPVPSAPAIVALALIVGPGQRTVETDVPTLNIPSGTQQVVLNLSLRENSYPRYRAVVHAIGGVELLRRTDLAPAPQSPHFTITVPADQLRAGNYMLTLQGADRDGEFEDLSQSLFRVATPPTNSPR